MNSLRHFTLWHDELPAFHASYLVLALLLSALFPLGAFGLLILAHMSLDLVKYRELHRLTWKKAIIATLRESLLDWMLLTAGLTLAVYLHHSIPIIASLSGLYRAELTIVQGLGSVIPKMKVLYRFAEIMSNMRMYLNAMPRYLGKSLSPVEHMCVIALCVFVLLLVLAPSILGFDAAHYATILRSELVPWRI